MNVEVVKEYYGKVLKGSKDLKTSACCDGGGVPGHLKTLIANVHEEVRSKYYGCGIVIPAALQGCNVLDLGSGSGRDVYLISQLVGEGGGVTGVDMTDEQLATAQAHKDWHMQKFGYAKPNVRFLKGYLEKLDPNTVILGFAVEICTAGTESAAASFGLCGACYASRTALDASACLCTAAGTLTIMTPGTDAGYLRSIGHCESYVTVCVSAAVCTPKFRTRLLLSRTKDHT